MKEQKRGGLSKRVKEKAARTYTEFRSGEPEIARLLLDRLPPETIAAARVLLDVIRSQEDSPQPWGIEVAEHLSENRASLLSQARDLLYRSFWFAGGNTLSPDELKAIFRLSGIHDQHLTNPIAQAIHKDHRNWSAPEKSYQDLVHRRYLGPLWVLDELDVRFNETDLHHLIFYMLHESGELVEDRSRRLRTRLRLSPETVRKIRLAQSK